MTISAAEAGDALAVIGSALERYSIVESEGFAVLSRISARLRAQKDKISWLIEVDRGQPILFRKTLDEKCKFIRPRIVAKGIQVNQDNDTRIPFEALDIALEINDSLDTPLSRWHLDLANVAGNVPQSGPLTHLQFGGHQHMDRTRDYPLKVPRWCHPPLEIGLLCEVVAANFFEEPWLELREEPNWCEAISLCERLCFTRYTETIMNSLSVSSSTVLREMWASTYL